MAGTISPRRSLCPPMPRYFFRIKNDIDVPDRGGKDVDDLASARQLAVVYARDLAAEAVCRGQVNLQHRIAIEDRANASLAQNVSSMDAAGRSGHCRYL